VWRVAADNDPGSRTLTADRAVELREEKSEATLFLVDTAEAGAGMDGLYSAAREVSEGDLFSEAVSLAAAEVTKNLSGAARRYAQQAVREARKGGKRASVPPWTEFDFLVHVAGKGKHPGAHLYLLGLWPVEARAESSEQHDLALSRFFVESLLGPGVARLTSQQRIASLKLLDPTPQQLRDLEQFLRLAAKKALLPALSELRDKEHLWVHALRVESGAASIQGLELVPWRTRTGRLAKWSGLVEEASGEPPSLILQPDAERTGRYSKLEVRWKARPERLQERSIQYRVQVISAYEEELAFKEVWHRSRPEQKCIFSNDDFANLSEDALVSAKVRVEAVESDTVEPVESEEFTIRFGEPPAQGTVSIATTVRAFSEGLVEFEDREQVSALASVFSPSPDGKGFLVLRDPSSRKAFRVFRPPLLREVEKDWFSRAGAIGRWSVRVRESGLPATPVEFHPIDGPEASPQLESLRERAQSAARRLAEQFEKTGGGAGQVYDQNSKSFDSVVRGYLLAWAALLEEDSPEFALANTVEVKTLSGRTIGLIVLPSHPVRVAWHVAYDNAVLHAVFEEGIDARELRREFRCLDGAMFPAFLPGLEPGNPFVFADVLGFHAVAMVPASDREPKASVALLARCYGESETGEGSPTVGKHSAQILADEVVRYLDTHLATRLLHVHALRAGDGMTVARALGEAQRRWIGAEQDADDGEEITSPLCFVLELYPSAAQTNLAGRFLSEASERRRTGAGSLAAEDRWLLESVSLEGGVNLPKLRWARKLNEIPDRPAHLVLAFDTLDSAVECRRQQAGDQRRPYHAFGLMSFFERSYVPGPPASWESRVPLPSEGEKHPSDRTHTERLLRLQAALQRCVAVSLGIDAGEPVLRTVVLPEKEDALRKLHQLADWVVTLDRNAAVEYFDSPRENPDVYETYVIDCVPERDDLGSLQLITTTSKLQEVRRLLDAALDEMGLSNSRRNAEFLLQHLRAISGRLAIRLTGQRAPTCELVALALAHAHCREAREDHRCWYPLDSGVLVPLDDVQDLLPPLWEKDGKGQKGVRPDFVYVSVTPRRGIAFQFVEVKYRRHLRSARSAELFHQVEKQVSELRRRWLSWYCNSDVPTSVRAIRRAKLARVLRFYAQKANRHFLGAEAFQAIATEIDRMLEKGRDYSFAEVPNPQRAWVFCPEFAGVEPLAMTPEGQETEVFLFGPALLPDSEFRRRSVLRMIPPKESENAPESAELRDVEGGHTQGASEEAGGSCPALELRLGSDVATGSPVTWKVTVSGNPHLLVAGLPGMGKTTCLINLCAQMAEQRVRPIVFSYHQDIDEGLQRKLGEVRFIDPDRLGFNPLRVADQTNPNAHLEVAGALRDIFLGIYPDLGDVQGEKIREAVKQSFLEKGWGTGRTAKEGLEEPKFSRFLEILRAEPRPDRGLRTLLARLSELADYGLFETGQAASIWDLEGPVALRLHKTQSDNLQRAFGALVLYALYKDMFQRGLRSQIEHALVLDEAHRAARLALIPRIGKECRKYGISMILASQEAKDFHDSVFSVVANYLVLRLNEADARVLVRNVATSDQERLLVDKIKRMERFRALHFSEDRRRPCVVALSP
jgi:DNA polymerase III delta prime subunit